MKRAWEFAQVEIDHAIVPDEEFKQLLDEWTEVVYRYLCQLSDQALVSETPLLGRTGTDG